MMPEEYPEIYHRETAQVVNSFHPAEADEIRECAKISLGRYLTNADYQLLSRSIETLDFKDVENLRLAVQNSINCVTGLENAITKDDLITMRRHKDPDGYLTFFAARARMVRELIPTANKYVEPHNTYSLNSTEVISDEPEQ